MGWGYTVPSFPIAVFFFRIYVSGCGLWRVYYYPLIKVQLKKVFTAGAAWIIVKFSGSTVHTRKPLASLQAKSKSWMIQHKILIISKQFLQKFTIMI